MQSLRQWLDSVGRRLVTSHHVVRGFDVTIENSRTEIRTDDVVLRLDGALGLIDRYTPHYGRHLRRDLAGIVVKRFPCRGAYFFESRTSLVELTFVVNPSFTEAQVAATILHEGMHARLHALGVSLEMDDRARQERFCRRAEIEFGRIVPGGQPVVDRALESLALADSEVAPEIDWTLAEKRIADADLEALKVPQWLKRAATRRGDGQNSEGAP
jgi:hypothetical protein